MEDIQTYDDAPDTQDGASAVSVDDSGSADSQEDNFGAMQDRMAAANDSPWYSDSEGKVLDNDGYVLTDPATGKPFASMEEYNSFIAKAKADAESKVNTAKPKTEEVKTPQKPMAKSFDSYALGDGGLTPEKLQALDKAGSDYLYNDDLIPKINAAQDAATQQTAPAMDPIEKVKADRKQWDEIAMGSLREVRQALINQGADPALSDQLLAPIMQKRQGQIDALYSDAYEKALLEKVDGKYGSKLSALENEKQVNASNANVEAMAKKYYPEGGKEAFFSLVNGHYDDKGQFVRGPAAQVIDFVAAIATDGKQFKTEAERSAAYSDTFRKVTADTAKAKALFDIAHYYYLGKQMGKAQNLIFQKGKEAAQQERQRINKTIKTRPASYAPPVTTTDDNDGMPSMLKTVMSGMRG